MRAVETVALLLAAAALAACQASMRKVATQAAEPVGTPATVAGTVTMGTVDDGGTVEIRILPLEPERIDAARREVTKAPDSPDAYGALGDELARQGHLDEAVAAYAEAVRLATDDQVAHFRLGLTQHVVGDLEAALHSYRETARLVPESAWAHAALSVVQLRLGDPVSALREYHIVRRLDPELAEGLFEIIAEEHELQQALRRTPSAERSARG